jgi:hypothetical protein
MSPTTKDTFANADERPEETGQGSDVFKMEYGRERKRKRKIKSKIWKSQTPQRKLTLRLKALKVVPEALAPLEIHARHFAVRKPKRQQHAEQAVPAGHVVNVLHVGSSAKFVAEGGHCIPIGTHATPARTRDTGSDYQAVSCMSAGRASANARNLVCNHRVGLNGFKELLYPQTFRLSFPRPPQRAADQAPAALGIDAARRRGHCEILRKEVWQEYVFHEGLQVGCELRYHGVGAKRGLALGKPFV